MLRGTVTGGSFGQSVTLTDTTANLAALIASGDSRQLFNEEPMIFRRIGGANARPCGSKKTRRHSERSLWRLCDKGAAKNR